MATLVINGLEKMQKVFSTLRRYCHQRTETRSGFAIKTIKKPAQNIILIREQENTIITRRTSKISQRRLQSSSFLEYQTAANEARAHPSKCWSQIQSTPVAREHEKFPYLKTKSLSAVVDAVVVKDLIAQSEGKGAAGVGDIMELH